MSERVKSQLRGEWVDDGHRVVPVLDYDTIHLRVECPGDGCKADRMACADCEGCMGCECSHCHGTGLEPETPAGFCWLRDMAPELDFIECFSAHRGQVDLTGDTRIVYKTDYDEWEWALRSEGLVAAGIP